MTTIPSEFMDRGPVPGGLVITLNAEEASVEGVLVTTGATDRSVKRCDIGDNPIGWSQGVMVAGAEASITLFNPMWKADVDAGSDAISFGDIISVADDGKVKKSSGSASEVVAGIALQSAAASGQVLFVPITSTPDPITT